MDKNWDHRIYRAYDDSSYFWEVLRVLFYGEDDDAERVTELNMDMFRDFCGHVKSTYQNLFIGAENPRRYMTLVRPYIILIELTRFPEHIDRPHDTLQTFANLACTAISPIEFVGSTENQLIVPSDGRLITTENSGWAVLYDFEKDTPEDVWNRVDE